MPQSGWHCRQLIRLALFLTALLTSPVFAEQGVSATKIMLGNSSPSTGSLAELNGEYQSGAKLYFDRLNRDGGIHGRTVELLTLDDGYDPARTEENVKALIHTHKVFALFGVFGTGQNLRALPVLTEARVPSFAPYTGADVLREPHNPYVFHLRASYGREIEAMIDHLVMLGVTSIAVVHHPDAFGQAGVSAAEAALAKKQRPPLTIVTPIAASGEGAGEVADKVIAANPAAVIMVAAGRSPPALIKALRERNAQPMLFGLSVVSSKQLVRELGADAHGVVLAQVTPSPFRIDHPILREYRRHAKEADLAYSYTALEGYIAARTFSEALERAGKELTRARLMNALESLEGWDVGGLTLHFSPTRHVGLDYVDLSVVSHGRFSH